MKNEKASSSVHRRYTRKYVHLGHPKSGTRIHLYPVAPVVDCSGQLEMLYSLVLEFKSKGGKILTKNAVAGIAFVSSVGGFRRESTKK